jgi:site-specific DNA-methyltransferase (adenine-specific)
VDLLWADPPYGAKEKVKRASRTRSLSEATSKSKASGQKEWARARDWKPLQGDKEAFNPAPLLAFPGKKILWGANYFSHLLPPSRSWLWWDKREEGTPDDNGDGELAWTTLGGPPRQLPFKWRGLIRRGVMNGLPRQHPTEKPPELSTWAFGLAKLQRGQRVLSTHLGSGPEVLSALEMGLLLVGCEVEEEYCERAVARILRHRVGGTGHAHKTANRGQQSMELLPLPVVDNCTTHD